MVVGAAWCCGFDRESLCTRAACCYVCAVACVVRCTKWLFCVPREPCPSLRAGFVVCPPIKHVDAARLLMLRVCACVAHHESVVVRPAAAASSGPAKVCRLHPSTQVHVTAAGCVSTTSQPRFCGLRAPDIGHILLVMVCLLQVLTASRLVRFLPVGAGSTVQYFLLYPLACPCDGLTPTVMLARPYITRL